MPYHLQNIDHCNLKCFGGSGAKIQHKTRSFALDGALQDALQWGAQCIFIYPDFVQNSIFNKPGKSGAISCAEVKRKLIEASDVQFFL